MQSHDEQKTGQRSAPQMEKTCTLHQLKDSSKARLPSTNSLIMRPTRCTTSSVSCGERHFYHFLVDPLMHAFSCDQPLHLDGFFPKLRCICIFPDGPLLHSFKKGRLSLSEVQLPAISSMTGGTGISILRRDNVLELPESSFAPRS